MPKRKKKALEEQKNALADFVDFLSLTLSEEEKLCDCCQEASKQTETPEGNNVCNCCMTKYGTYVDLEIRRNKALRN